MNSPYYLTAMPENAQSKDFVSENGGVAGMIALAGIIGFVFLVAVYGKKFGSRSDFNIVPKGKD